MSTFTIKYIPNNWLFNDLVSCHKDPLEYKWINNVVAVAGVSDTLTQIHNDTWYGTFVEEHKLEINVKLIKPKTLTEIIKSTDITLILNFSIE